MRPRAALLGALLLAWPAGGFAAPAGYAPSTRTAWFQAARFGLFIHWGPSSSWGDGVLEPRRKTSPDSYAARAMRFNPRNFDAPAWVRLAKKAGMRYIVFTAKHHDGFCMFDSALTEFKITRTPFKRDVLGELARAARAEKMPLGIYYSLSDWHHAEFRGAAPAPDGLHPAEALHAGWSRYVDYLHGQLRELSSRYGPVPIFWFDTGGWVRPPEDLRMRELFTMLRRRQPRALLNERGFLPGDFRTFERHIPDPAPEAGGAPAVWETCLTINDHWGYSRADRRFKSASFLIQRLAKAAGRGGNLLLNVGPMPDGSIQPEFVERLRAMGRWLEKNGESIYGTSAGPVPYAPGRYTSTAKGDAVYLHVFRRPRYGFLSVPWSGGNISRAVLLEKGRPLSHWRFAGRLWVRIPPGLPESGDTVIKVRGR